MLSIFFVSSVRSRLLPFICACVTTIKPGYISTDGNPTCCNQIHFDILHSDAAGTQKLLPFTCLYSYTILCLLKICLAVCRPVLGPVHPRSHPVYNAIIKEIDCLILICLISEGFSMATNPRYSGLLFLLIFWVIVTNGTSHRD